MHVINNNGTGTAVVLVHGNSLSAETWRAQLDAPELAHHRLLAPDLPGHGRSAWNAQDEPYTLEGLAHAVAAMIAPLPKVVLVGHSLGGHVAMRVLARVQNVSALMLCGAPPLRGADDMARAFLPGPALAKAFEPALNPGDAAGMAAAWSWDGCAHQADLATMILAADPRVRADLGAQIARGDLQDELALLRNSGVPTAMVHGTHDLGVNGTYLEDLAPHFWRGRVHALDGTGHMPQLQRPTAFNHILNELIAAHG